MIAVVDYGMGNLRSVEKALQVVGGKTKVTSRPADLAKAEKIVFPGVGSFGEAMAELRRRKLVTPIKAAIAGGTPFLGLCLGLQLLFQTSDEAPGVGGLGILRGRVRKFRVAGSGRETAGSGKKIAGSGKVITEVRLKVPHMGWNCISRTPYPATRNPTLLSGVPDGSFMYFVHSYYAAPADKSIALTMTDYGIDFVSGIAKDNIYGLQFHPEKSQKIGLKILENFVKL